MVLQTLVNGVLWWTATHLACFVHNLTMLWIPLFFVALAFYSVKNFSQHGIMTNSSSPSILCSSLTNVMTPFFLCHVVLKTLVNEVLWRTATHLACFVHNLTMLWSPFFITLAFNGVKNFSQHGVMTNSSLPSILCSSLANVMTPFFLCQMLLRTFVNMLLWWTAARLAFFDKVTNKKWQVDEMTCR